MKKTMMALIAFTLISGMAIASDNKKAETKTSKTACNQKDCKDKKDCKKTCNPAACSKKC